jgi:hypothetical protein
MTKFTSISSAPTRYINSVHEDIGLTDKDRAKRKERIKRKNQRKEI